MRAAATVLTSAEREELELLALEPSTERGVRDPLKSRCLVRHGGRPLEALFGFVKVNQAAHSVGKMCRLPGASRSGYIDTAVTGTARRK